MSVTPIWTVHCETLGESCAWVMAPEASRSEALQVAQGAGWTRRRMENRLVDLCPRCNERWLEGRREALGS